LIVKKRKITDPGNNTFDLQEAPLLISRWNCNECLI